LTSWFAKPALSGKQGGVYSASRAY